MDSQNEAQDPGSRAESCPGTFETQTTDTDLTLLSHSLRSLDAHSDEDDEMRGNQTLSVNEILRDLNEASDTEKASVLKEMFPNTSDYSVSHTLQKCAGDVDRAMDELLNHAFFDSGELMDGEEAFRAPTKGIEAFSEDQARRRRKNKKNKKRHWNGQMIGEGDMRRSSSIPTSSSRVNPWQTGTKDIEMIAECTQLSKNTVGSVYHSNSASTPLTVAALLDAPMPSSHPNAKIEEHDARVRAHAYELGQEFPSIPPSRLASVVRLTFPSTTFARKLAKALTETRSGTGGIEVIPRYGPISRTDNGGSPREWSAVASTPRQSNNVSLAASPAQPRHVAAAHSALSSRAYDQASAAYRRGRSDHLMSGAAAYYSQVARDHAQAASEARGQAADQLVDSQSGSGVVDLHGVSVKDAVRIAKLRTERWWRGGARGVMGLDGRLIRNEGGRQRLEIVTGVGRHSRGGKGMIGPAVGRMLVNDGWQVQFEEGVVLVTGRRR